MNLDAVFFFMNKIKDLILIHLKVIKIEGKSIRRYEFSYILVIQSKSGVFALPHTEERVRLCDKVQIHQSVLHVQIATNY